MTTIREEGKKMVLFRTGTQRVLTGEFVGYIMQWAEEVNHHEKAGTFDTHLHALMERTKNFGDLMRQESPGNGERILVRDLETPPK